MSARPDAQHRRRDSTPAPEPPQSSWWCGCSRAEFTQRQKDQQPRMTGLATTPRPNLSTAIDARKPPTSYPERTQYWEDV
jgi:hypothetical protein